LHLAALDYSTDDLPAFLHPRRASWIVCDRKRIGFLGEVHPGVMVQWDLRGRSFVAELDVEGILSCMRPLSAARELAKFPFSTRDIALVLPQEMEAGGLIKTIHQMGEELLENVQIFDVYSGPNLPVGKKSLGIRLSYRSSQKTLTDEEVSQVHGRIVRQLVEVSGAIIRGEEA
jgi:phenylalanyl-tRNA synthetase beta chain